MSFRFLVIPAILLTFFAKANVQAEEVNQSTATPQEITNTDSKNGIAKSSSGFTDSDSVSGGGLSISMFTLGGYDDSQFKRADPAFSIYDSYISFSYKIQNNIRLSVRPSFAYTTDGYDYQGNQVTSKLSNRDLFLVAAQNHVFEDYLPASMQYKHQIRLYLPTSDYSKDEGMIARLRLEFEGKYFLGRYSNIRAYIKPSYFIQRNTVYTNYKGYLATTRDKELVHGAEFDINLNKYFSIKPGYEAEDDWSNESQANKGVDLKYPDVRHTSEIGYRLGFEIRPSRDFNFTVGIQDKHDLINPNKPAVVSYSLMTNLSIY